MNRRKKQAEQEHGSSYTPGINALRVSSQGEVNIITDWKTGRRVHCLSLGEARVYRILRWSDRVADVREQFALPYGETFAIAKKAGFPFPYTPEKPMTTDFLVTFEDGSEAAFSYKDHLGPSEIDGTRPSDWLRSTVRTERKLMIEKMYWGLRGVPWMLVQDKDVNRTLAGNIETATACYDIAKVFDMRTFGMYLVAHKIIKVDMAAPIDWQAVEEEAARIAKEKKEWKLA